MSKGYSPSSMTKSSNKGKTVGGKYSGIEFLQTPGRTPASGSLLEGTPVLRIPARRNPSSPLRSTPGLVPRTAPFPRVSCCTFGGWRRLVTDKICGLRPPKYFESFELAFQCLRFEVNQHPIAEVIPVLLKSGQSASREEAVEEMKDY
ncbi:hypothetical protein F2Q69_00024056 [Brassica cretica]|uniref:Uncharacterized protein n=1 Tax=Brassica cretica TaxID=69181 RepID=A0A8S9QPH4_BRACR|nr:hypothetical protein F2Q69_00024056 [Brassica cretica]